MVMNRIYPCQTKFFGTRTFFIRAVPKIFCSVNGAQVYIKRALRLWYANTAGEGKRRKVFAEWYVEWRAEWHNYAKYDLRGE